MRRWRKNAIWPIVLGGLVIHPLEQAQAEMAAIARHSSAGAPVGTWYERTRKMIATTQPAIAGRKNIQCALVENSTFSPGCRISSI